VFPKYVAKEFRGKFDEVIKATELVASPTCELSPEAKRALVQAKVDALPAVRREDTTGLRENLLRTSDSTRTTKRQI
jgi:hypothetical protein